MNFIICSWENRVKRLNGELGNGIIAAMNAVQGRFKAQAALYGNVSGDDAKRLYSDSMAAVFALGFSLGVLSEELNALVRHRKGRIDDALDLMSQLVERAKGNVDGARAALDREVRDAYQIGANIAMAAAGGTFRTAKLTQIVTAYILLSSDITGWSVVAAVGATDKYYQNEAVKRFLELVSGFLAEKLEPFPGAGKVWECLVAIRDIFVARVNDMRAADDTFTRERNYQTLLHLAGLQVERMALAIRELSSASTGADGVREISWGVAGLSWRERLNDANKALERNTGILEVNPPAPAIFENVKQPGGRGYPPDGSSRPVEPSVELPEDERPVWERIASLAAALPEETIAGLPVDGASQLDHYVHGSSKRDR